MCLDDLALSKAQLGEPFLGILIFLFSSVFLSYFSRPVGKAPALKTAKAALKTPKPALKQPNRQKKKIGKTKTGTSGPRPALNGGSG